MSSQFPVGPGRGRPPIVLRGSAPPAGVLERYNAKILDPGSVVVLPDQQRRPRPTVYIADRLIAPSLPPGRPPEQDIIVQGLREVALALGMDISERVTPLGDAARLLHIVPSGASRENQVPVVVDAWPILQRARGQFRGAFEGVGLDHLLVMHHGPGISGLPYDEPHGPISTALPGSGYGTGYAGPYPVAVAAASPPAPCGDPRTRPVVAVVDTGCGSHPWLPDGGGDPVILGAADPSVSNPLATIGADPSLYAYPGPEDAVEWDRFDLPMDGARPVAAGHGTFICGLIRQACPDASILPIRLLDATGYAAEHDLITVLNEIHRRALAYAHNQPGGQRVDVVSLSLGYYEEEDGASGGMMLTALQDLGRLGIVVVASAGNDASQRPMFPSAFTPHAGGPVVSQPTGVVPVISVGALNPDGSTVALFSNSGGWVRCWEIGAGLVSTMPAWPAGDGMNFGMNPSATRPDPGRPATVRQSIDPDRFTTVGTGHALVGGFAQWSGTSFASPLMAARVARWLADPQHAVSTINAATGTEAVKACCSP